MSTDDLDQLRQAATARIEDLAVSLLGQPTSRDQKELRWSNEYDTVVAISGKKRGLWYDFSNSEGGDVIKLVQEVRGCGFGDAVTWLRGALAMPAPERRERRDEEVQAPQEDSEVTRKSIEMASKIWHEAYAGADTPAQKYLEDIRGLAIPEGVWGSTLRYHANCWIQGQRFPALIGLLRNVETNEPGGIQRIAIDPHGNPILRPNGKKVKASLGNVKNHACMLTPSEDVTNSLFLSEGIETGLSAMMFQGYTPMWAAISADNVRRFPILQGIDSIGIVGDRDASVTGQKSAIECADRWADAGRQTAVYFRKVVGKDFADA